MKALDRPNFKLTGEIDDPSDIDFDIRGYHKERIITSGELRTVNYYREYIPETQVYNDLIVKEERLYTRDNVGIVQYRTLTITWYMEDDSIGLVKTGTPKYYSYEEAIQEGIDRRNNMISLAKTTLLRELKLIVGEPTNQSYAFDFLLGVSTQMNYFREGYTQPLRDAVANSTKAYLTQDIKTKVIQNLTF